MKAKKKMKPYTVKLDPAKLEKAKKLGLDLPEAIRQMLDEAIDEKRCPSCGSWVPREN